MQSIFSVAARRGTARCWGTPQMPSAVPVR
jgi:hypothetical protein